MGWRPQTWSTKNGLDILVPLVFETNGRASDEAVAFVRAYGVGLPQANRAEVIGTTWRQISRTLQLGNAEMVLSAVV